MDLLSASPQKEDKFLECSPLRALVLVVIHCSKTSINRMIVTARVVGNASSTCPAVKATHVVCMLWPSHWQYTTIAPQQPPMILQCLMSAIPIPTCISALIIRQCTHKLVVGRRLASNLLRDHLRRSKSITQSIVQEISTAATLLLKGA
jgi:hypothetical protein